jgi:S-adenosylmethionine:tRNA ribosyltransferase-isomerase
MNMHTQIFIHPPYVFKIVDILMTNFHLPKSTLFMLICAFVGKETAFEIYSHAMSQQYRFYSYGDSSLLFR